MLQKIVNRSASSQNYSIPAPTGGLNLRDSMDNMPQEDAFVMDNYIPLDSKVVLRKGYQRYVTLSEQISTLISYKLPLQNRLLAFGSGKMFDITSPQEIITYDKNFTENDWQYCQFKNRLILVNGVDTPQTYYIEDTIEHFEDLAISGENLIIQKLVNVCVSKQRLFFVEKGSLNIWYTSGVGEVQGTLYKLDLSTIFRDGGELIAVTSWTQDGGQGIDDLTVFLTSEGEVAVYSGSNPNDAEDWTLKGIYRMSRPIGYRCTIQYQGDVVIISEDGYIPLSKALPVDKLNSSLIAFSDKIRSLVLERTQNNKNKKGWQGIIYHRGGYAIFNVPIEQSFEQHVINTNTGAWCRFTNIPAICWIDYGDRIYFGAKDGVFLFDEGYTDDNMYICGHVEQAYNTLGSSNLKRLQLINPRTKSFNKYTLVVYVNMDFDTQEKAYRSNVGYDGQSNWDEVFWSSEAEPSGAYWATLQGEIRSQWIAISAVGFKASIVFKTKTRGNLIEWYDTGVRYEQGQGLY